MLAVAASALLMTPYQNPGQVDLSRLTYTTSVGRHAAHLAGQGMFIRISVSEMNRNGFVLRYEETVGSMKLSNGTNVLVPGSRWYSIESIRIPWQAWEGADGFSGATPSGVDMAMAMLCYSERVCTSTFTTYWDQNFLQRGFSPTWRIRPSGLIFLAFESPKDRGDWVKRMVEEAEKVGVELKFWR